MPPRECAGTPFHTWNQLVCHSRTLRNELRFALSLPFSKISLVETPTGCKVYALGTPACQKNRTLLAADISFESDETSVFLHTLFDSNTLKSSAPSQEFSLMCERQRSSVVSGVNDYTIHPLTKSVLLNTGDNIFRFSEENMNVVESDASFLSGDSGFVYDVQICPSDSSVISYVINKQVHVDAEHGPMFCTSSEGDDVSNGMPSFIAQEELDRFEAVWWSPCRTRLLYERVDESRVKSLYFACPGKELPSPMKYPLAGSENAISDLRLICLENGKIRHAAMKFSLKQHFPWIEYLARAGFLNDGKTVWVQVLDRPQSRCALIIIPESEFEGFDARTSPVMSATIVHDEQSEAWINTHNTIIPLHSRDSLTVEFIYASEVCSNCHLYLVGVLLNKNREVVEKRFRAITSGNYSVCKSTAAVVDESRRLVYYVANCSSPSEWSVCVASCAENETPVTKQLTGPGLSFKSERSHHKLSLLPNVGFVCWMTSVGKPPQCYFYSLSHSSCGGLPDAKLKLTIALPGCTIPPTLPTVLPEIVQYHSRNSGREHCAMIIRPSGYVDGKSYPVVQYVYGGPGIQLVKNDYTAWISFQKFTKLGYVVIMIDGRGSSNRGSDFESPIKGNMGFCEVDDQVEGLSELAQMTNGLLDLSRVLVQGWSYGGYMSLLCLARYPQTYRAAIAGGAVTDWRLYDTAYTERYLGFPLSAVYDKCSVGRLVELLPDEPGRLLILHGLIDENVHFRHTELLIETLIKYSKPYQLQVFPSERHGVRSSEGATHMDATMLHFTQEALK